MEGPTVEYKSSSVAYVCRKGGRITLIEKMKVPGFTESRFSLRVLHYVLCSLDPASESKVDGDLCVGVGMWVEYLPINIMNSVFFA